MQDQAGKAGQTGETMGRKENMPCKGLTPVQRRWYEQIRAGALVTPEFKGWIYMRRVVDVRVEHALRATGHFCTVEIPGKHVYRSQVMHIDSVCPEGGSVSSIHWTTKTDPEETICCLRCTKKVVDPVEFGTRSKTHSIREGRFFCLKCTCHECGDEMTRYENTICLKCLEKEGDGQNA